MEDLRLMNFDNNKIKSIKGDASFRKFYRKINKKKNSIIVYSGKEKSKNLLNYDAINKLFLKKKILAPKLLLENYTKNFIEIEDLGKKTLFDILKKNNNKILIYKKILNILKKIQSIKIKKIKNFKNRLYRIPTYTKKLLYEESSLFLKWYVPYMYNGKNINRINIKLKKNIKFLLSEIKLPNDTFVHRDFHVSNLMLKNNSIYVIDSQDAVYGNIVYDLASLIDDARFKTTNQQKKKIYRIYLKLNKGKINIKKFKNDFAILSVLRNLKILGIFVRLAKRDNKKKYLKLIPYIWKLIDYRMNNNNKFITLKNNLKKLKKIN